jgi:hypothetical protein
MAAQSFYVHSTPAAKAYALVPYHPYTLKTDGGRMRNPKFDSLARHILNLKSESERGFQAAVNFWTPQLATFFKELAFKRAEIVVVPSSTKGDVGPGLDKIVTAICKQDQRLVYYRNSLHRTHSIDKLSRGGDRSIDVHLRSMDYKGVQGSPALKFILDDISTTGNSLNASITVIQQYMHGLTFIGVVLGKTANGSF